MLNICDILSICAEGGNTFPEDSCEVFFSLEQLIQYVSLFLWRLFLVNEIGFLIIRILDDSVFPIEMKKPFASLLTRLISDREPPMAVSIVAKPGSVIYLLLYDLHSQ